MNYLTLNTALNKIHSWSQPEQPPMMRMFLTRTIEIVAAVIEAATIVFTAIGFVYSCGKQLVISSSQIGLEIFPHTQRLQEFAHLPSAINDIVSNARGIASLIGGLASTIFFGIFISPEANFKIHLRLELVTDDLATQSKNTLTAKLELEKQKSEVNKTRSNHLASLETSNEKAEIAILNKRLTELLSLTKQ